MPNCCSQRAQESPLSRHSRQVIWRAGGGSPIRPVTFYRQTENQLFVYRIHHPGSAAGEDCVLRRHPLDTIWSVYKHLFATHLSHYNYSYDLLDTAAYYVMFDRLIRFWHRVYPGRIREMRYEALVENPEQECRSLFAYCGIDRTADCLRFHETGGAAATPSVVQVRQPNYRGVVGQSHARMSANLPPCVKFWNDTVSTCRLLGRNILFAYRTPV